MLKKRLSAIIILLCLTVTAAVLFMPNVVPKQAKAAELTRYSNTFFGTFDTLITVIGFAPNEETFNRHLEAVKGIYEDQHRLFDIYHEYEGVNNLYVLNRDAAKAPVPVDQELFDLLAYCKDLQRQDGNETVNIALGAVLSIWHDYREQAESNPAEAAVPPLDILKEAAKHTNIDDMVLDPEQTTVYFSDSELKLDLGAVAKGYATERASQYLLASDMPSFIISAGGNVRAGNPPEDGRRAWSVGIQDPESPAFGNGLSDTLYLSNRSVVTSGDYQRFYMIDGVRYHHIISPKTLMPADFFRSVTIVTEDSVLADYLSTALYLMPYEEGRAYVESLQGVEALWILNDLSTEMTDGLVGMAKSKGASD